MSRSTIFNKVVMVLFLIIGCGLSQKVLAQNESISETIGEKKAAAPVQESSTISEDTLSSGTNLKMESQNRSNSNKKIYIEVDQHQQVSSNLQAAIASGKGMTTAGLVLHFVGLGVTTITSFVNTSGSDPSAMLIVNLGAYGMQIAGPIVACAGASTVKNAAEKEGLESGFYSPWKEYGRGWAFNGVGAGLVIASMFILLGSTDGGSAIIAVPLLLGGAGFMIAGEVSWIQAMVHAKIYTGKFDDMPKKQSISWMLSPTVDAKQRIGLMLNARF